jgi:hypothetical protein
MQVLDAMQIGQRKGKPFSLCRCDELIDVDRMNRFIAPSIATTVAKRLPASGETSQEDVSHDSYPSRNTVADRRSSYGIQHDWHAASTGHILNISARPKLSLIQLWLSITVGGPPFRHYRAYLRAGVGRGDPRPVPGVPAQRLHRTSPVSGDRFGYSADWGDKMRARGRPRGATPMPHDRNADVRLAAANAIRAVR